MKSKKTTIVFEDKKVKLSRGEMIDVLTENKLEYWVDSGTGVIEVEEVLLNGWKGFDKYTNQELKEQIEGTLEFKQIAELLDSYETRHTEKFNTESNQITF